MVSLQEFKQILSYVRSLGPHTWVKLTLNDILISVKQIPNNVRFLRLHTYVKSTLSGIYTFFLSAKIDQNYFQLLGFVTLSKLMSIIIYLSVGQKGGYLLPSILY